MGTKVEHLLNRDGRYYARIVIPKALRSYLDGKTELRTPLGADRRVAKANLPAAIATMQVQIGIARERASKAERRDVRVGHYPMAMPAMVWQDYLERTRLDTEIRAQDHRYAEMEVDADQARRYRDGFAGKLHAGDDDEHRRTVPRKSPLRHRRNRPAVPRPAASPIRAVPRHVVKRGRDVSVVPDAHSPVMAGRMGGSLRPCLAHAG